MAYFPFFIELGGREGLVVGGGAVALRKVEKLLPYGPKLTVLAPEILPEFKKMDSITCLEISFTPAALQGKDFVIAATDDAMLNQSIAQACQARRILVNVVDDPENCGFLFPALVKQGQLCVGISTGGASPSAAVYVKNRVAECLPENMEAILDYLSAIRQQVKEALPEGCRGAVFKALFDACMDAGRPLTETELNALLCKEVRPC